MATGLGAPSAPRCVICLKTRDVGKEGLCRRHLAGLRQAEADFQRWFADWRLSHESELPPDGQSVSAQIWQTSMRDAYLAAKGWKMRLPDPAE